MANLSVSLFQLPNEITVDDMVLPGDHVKLETIHRIRKMEPRPGDVLVATYPRSGTTWMLEAVSLILNDGDIKAVSSKFLSDRALFLEHNPATKEPGSLDNTTLAEQMTEGRLLKTHLPFKYVSNLVCSDLVKTVVVMRNPKDMLVSLFHFYQINKVLGWFDGSWNHFFELFQQKRLIYGDWLDHITSYWENCSQMRNVLFIKYEDAKDDIKSTLKKLAVFLNKNFDDDTLEVLAEHVSFEKMKKNPTTNLQKAVDMGLFKDDTFIRRGTVGNWKKYFSEEQSIFVDHHHLKAAENIGLSFRVG